MTTGPELELEVPAWAEPADVKQARDVVAGDVLVFLRPGTESTVRPLLVLSSDHGLSLRMVPDGEPRMIDGEPMARLVPSMVLTQIIRLIGGEEIEPEWDDRFLVRIPT